MKRKAKSQAEHAEINAKEYPGTRQICASCGEPTGRCEEDSLYRGYEGPFCFGCYSRGAGWRPSTMPRRNFSQGELLWRGVEEDF